MAVVIIGLSLTVIKINYKFTIPIALLVGIVLVFPLISVTRKSHSFAQLFSHLSLSVVGESFFSGDFDAYTLLAYTIKYVREHGITYGRQLAGVLLFWIPRAWWPSKPIGSGYLVAETLQLPWKNISSPLPAEGLINFGLVGVAMFALLWSVVFRFLDLAYWRKKQQSIPANPLYPFLLGFTIFQLRGDLLSSTAYITAFIIAFLPLFLWQDRKDRGRQERVEE